MMRLTYISNDPYFLLNAAFDYAISLEGLSFDAVNSTEFTLSGDPERYDATFTGTGFTYGADGAVTGGTLQAIDVPTIGSLTGVNWDIPTLFQALQAIEDSRDYDPLTALFNQGTVLEVDASGVSQSLSFERFLGLIDDGLTTPVHYTGSDFGEVVTGGQGNDRFTLGANQRGRDIYYATAGNDSVDLASADGDGPDTLYYGRLSGSVTLNLNGATDTVRVISSEGEDTITGAAASLVAQGVEFFGTNEADIFNVTLGADQWLELYGMEGADQFDLTIGRGGFVTLNFDWNGRVNAQTGVVVDLQAGVIENDGFGFRDTISVTGAGQVELVGSTLADRFTGSDRDEKFVLFGGDDTVDAGAGVDGVSYRSSAFSSVQVDLLTYIATGAFNEVGFTHQLRGVEDILGSQYDDTISGSDTENWLLGNDGDDSLIGLDGDDTLRGQDGDDTLLGDKGQDHLRGGGDDDSIRGGGDQDTLLGDGGHDRIYGGSGGDSLLGGRGNDTLRGQAGHDSLEGGAGRDNLNGGGAQDTLLAGDGRDSLKGGSGDDLLFGDDEKDWLNGNAGNDTLNGGEGRDGLNGGGGNDVLRGGSGNDNLKGGAGADVFVFSSGHHRDVIADFELGVDQLRLAQGMTGGRSAEQIVADAQINAQSVVLEFENYDRIVLNGITDTAGLAASIEIV
jgi:Ca2+-binding RTX toxin-like protein